jgi:hypothetical protein
MTTVKQLEEQLKELNAIINDKIPKISNEIEILKKNNIEKVDEVKNFCKNCLRKRKVYSLLGIYQYEGMMLIGVFSSVNDILKYLASNKQKHFYEMGYVETNLGETIDLGNKKNCDDLIEYVDFMM